MNSPAEVRTVKGTQATRRTITIRKAASDGTFEPQAEGEQVVLERVLGITASTNASLACNPVTGVLAYPAGCTIVLFHPHTNKQEFIHNTSKKTITCLAFSKDGKWLAIGESGHQPSARVWDIEDNSYPQIAEMANGHKHGIACIAFSPDLKHLVSVGFQHDMLVNMWSLKDGAMVGCNKVSTKVYGVYFSENGDYFVTCGVRHVKFWYFDPDSRPKDSKDKNQKQAAIPINGRSGLLGNARNSAFCDVTCGLGKTADRTYCVTNDGKLCSFGSTRFLEESVDLQVSRALCVSMDEQYICCGCTNGIVRICDPVSLEVIASLPRPHFLGVNVSEATYPSYFDDNIGTGVYPDVNAVTLDSINKRVTCVYNDHSLYVWDIRDLENITVIWSSLYHSAPVWGVTVYPDISASVLPPGSFLSCSGDGTVRIWNVDEAAENSTRDNICSKELLHILYVDDRFVNLKDAENSLTGKNVRQVKNEDDRRGVKSLAVSADGKMLAIGDRAGNVRLYTMPQLKEKYKIVAHESEVLSVEFSPRESGCNLLATAGRDRLIQVFDANQDFALIQTLDDHSSSITSVKFNVHSTGALQLLSCGADRTIYFRVAQKNPELQFVRVANFVGKTRLHDLVIDKTRNLAATACQDRMIRVYDSSTGRQLKSYRGSGSDDGILVKVSMDKSGYYTASSCSDKTVSIYDFETGDFNASLLGHSEQVTDIVFTNDCRKLITVSGDGCIFIWALPTSFTQNIVDRLGELGLQVPNKETPTPRKRRLSEQPIRRIVKPLVPDSVQENGAAGKQEATVMTTQDTSVIRTETFTITTKMKENRFNPELERHDEIPDDQHNDINGGETIHVSEPGTEETSTELKMENGESFDNKNGAIRKDTFKVNNVPERPNYLPLASEDTNKQEEVAARPRSHTEPVVNVSQIEFLENTAEKQDTSKKHDPGNLRPKRRTLVKEATAHESASSPAEETDSQIQESSRNSKAENPVQDESQSESDNYRFSVGQLPPWARSRINSKDNGKPTSKSSTPKSLQSPVSTPTTPAGRWAERLNSTNGSITDSKASITGVAVTITEKKPQPIAQPEPMLGAEKKSKKKSSSSKRAKHHKCILL